MLRSVFFIYSFTFSIVFDELRISDEVKVDYSLVKDENRFEKSLDTITDRYSSNYGCHVDYFDLK